MLNHDPRPGHKRLDWSELDRILCENVTGFAEVERVWRPSSSSYLYRQEDGKELIGVGGWRCYVIVYDAASIPSVGAFIYQRLWAAGYGYVEVSKSGQFLDRCLVDAAVWQPERLDFAAAPVLKPGIQRRAPEAVILPGAPMLFSSRITATFTMPEWRKASKDLQLAKDAMPPKAETVRQQFLKDKIIDLRAAGSPIKDRRAKEILTAAVTHNVLSSDFPLRTAEGENITVGDIRATAERFDGTRFADPLEPDYRNDHRIAFANLSAEPPYIFSHAHGGWTYRLYRESADILIERGELPRAVDETLEVMASRGDMYERAGELVILNSETVAPVNSDYLADYASPHFSPGARPASGVPFEAIESRPGSFMVTSFAPENRAPEVSQCILWCGLGSAASCNSA